MGILSKYTTDTRRDGNTDFHPTDELIAIESAASICNEEFRALDALNKGMIVTERHLETVAIIKGEGLAPEALDVAKESYATAIMALDLVDGEKEAEAIAIESASSGDGALAKIWNAFKETMKKVWTYIVEMVTRLVNFIKGIFGKKDATADELEKLLKKLKEQGKTNQKATKFEEIVAKRLAKEVKLIVVAYDTKLSGSDYVKFINTQAKVLEGADKLLAEDILQENNVKGTISAIIKASDKWSDKISEPSDKDITEIFNAVKDEINEDIIDSGDYYFEGSVVGITPRELKIMLIYADKEKWDEIKNDKNLADEVKYEKLANLIKVKTFTYAPGDDKAAEKHENIVPLTFGECENIVAELKKVGKVAKKVAENITTKLNKAEKAVKKFVDTVEKSDNEEVKKLIGAVRAVASAITSEAKAKADGINVTAISIVRSPIGHVVKESARLMEKD